MSKIQSTVKFACNSGKTNCIWWHVSFVFLLLQNVRRVLPFFVEHNRQKIKHNTYSLEVLFKSFVIFRRYNGDVASTTSVSVTFASLNIACM